MTQPYDQNRLPPIPVLNVWLAVPDSNDWHGPFPAIVDSGADLTIVPLGVLSHLAAPYLKRAVLRSQWEERQVVFLHEIDLKIGDLVLPGIDVAGDDISHDLLLGRNALNRLDLRLEGPKLRTHILGA